MESLVGITKAELDELDALLASMEEVPSTTTLAALKAEPIFPGDSQLEDDDSGLDKIEISFLGDLKHQSVEYQSSEADEDDSDVVDIGGPEDLSFCPQPSSFSSFVPRLRPDPAFPNLTFVRSEEVETLASGRGREEDMETSWMGGSSEQERSMADGGWVELETKQSRPRGGGRRPRPPPQLTEAQIAAAHIPQPVQVSPLERLPDKKPTFSYVAMVTMVLRASETGSLTLQEIYTAISRIFPYYRLSERTWQNSIRHTMSFNDCFIRVTPARHVEKGKDRGGCWTMHPEAGEMFYPGTTAVRRRAKKFRLPGKLPPKRRNQKLSKTLPASTQSTNVSASPTIVSQAPSFSHVSNVPQPVAQPQYAFAFQQQFSPFVPQPAYPYPQYATYASQSFNASSGHPWF